jgi:hypothetical protein
MPIPSAPLSSTPTKATTLRSYPQTIKKSGGWGKEGSSPPRIAKAAGLRHHRRALPHQATASARPIPVPSALLSSTPTKGTTLKSDPQMANKSEGLGKAR